MRIEMTIEVPDFDPSIGRQQGVVIIQNMDDGTTESCFFDAPHPVMAWRNKAGHYAHIFRSIETAISGKGE